MGPKGVNMPKGVHKNMALKVAKNGLSGNLFIRFAGGKEDLQKRWYHFNPCHTTSLETVVEYQSRKHKMVDGWSKQIMKIAWLLFC